VKDSHSSKSPI
jgi:hypothetical protein